MKSALFSEVMTAVDATCPYHLRQLSSALYELAMAEDYSSSHVEEKRAKVRMALQVMLTPEDRAV